MGLESVVQEEGIASPTRPCFERNSQYYDTQIALTPYPPRSGGTNDLTGKGVRMGFCGIFIFENYMNLKPLFRRRGIGSKAGLSRGLRRPLSR